MGTQQFVDGLKFGQRLGSVMAQYPDVFGQVLASF
jgi:hypothetical protein